MTNNRRSGGPRTAAGKSIASRNALRHGFAALAHRKSASPADIASLARAMCDGDDDLALHTQAKIVAEHAMVLRGIRKHKLTVVERLRIPTTRAFAKGDNSLALAKIRSKQARIAADTLDAVVPVLLAKYKIDKTDEFAATDRGDLVPIALKLFMQEPDSIDEHPEFLERARKELGARDEHQAFVEASADLLKLDRYERRVWSQQKRAIYQFINIKLMNSYNAPKAHPSQSDTSQSDSSPSPPGQS
jgi:hypothetical protein